MIRNRYIPVTAFVLVSTVIVISSLTQTNLYDIALSTMLGLAMSVIVITDARYFIIPDIISLPMIVLGILLSPLFPHLQSGAEALLLSSLAALLGFIFFLGLRWLYSIYRGREGLGMGDVKIAAVAGAWTGPEGLNLVVLLSCILAFCFIGGRYISGRAVSASTAFPFGVFIAPSIWIIWLLQSVYVL